MASSDTIRFVGGDDLVEPFTISANGSPVDLTGLSVTGEIRWGGAVQIVLAPEAGLNIANMQADPIHPHGFIILTKQQTAQVPTGRVAKLRLHVTYPAGGGGYVLSSFDRYLDRL